MITRNITLYIGDDYPVRIPLSQYDTMWSFVFKIVLDGEEWTIPVGATAVLNGHKPDNNVFAFSGTIAANRVTVNCDVQITAVAGDVECELTIMDNGTVVGTANFVFMVEPAPKLDDQTISTSALDAYGEILTQIGTLSGEMIPPGGTTGQVLSKASNDDYDTEWTTPSGGGGGSVNDVTVAGTSVVSSGTAVIPKAGSAVFGVVKVNQVTATTTAPSYAEITADGLVVRTPSVDIHDLTLSPKWLPVATTASKGAVIVDATLTSSGTNPVQGGAIYSAIDAKITAPSSPATGAFLTWSGSAWIAQTLSTWQGGSY